MEVVNKKDGNKNFMIIKGIEIDENDYKFKMLKNNNIENVIPIGLRVIDGEKQLYYNVTEYITVKAMFSRKKMSGKDLYNLIKDIKKLSKSTKEYLMDLNDPYRVVCRDRNIQCLIRIDIQFKSYGRTGPFIMVSSVRIVFRNNHT